MASLVVLYKTPKDTAAFDKYYFDTHAPLAKKLPGARTRDVSKRMVASPARPSDVHLVALLQFDSLAAIQQALTTPEGQAAAGDLSNFASGGVDLLMFDTREV